MKQKAKNVTQKQAYARMTRICARKEYAPYEIRQKLLLLGLADNVVDKLVKRLIKERYIDERRYAESYIRDKLHFNKWGKRKIELHLAQKRISPDVVGDAFAQFSESQFSELLLLLLQKKLKSVSGRSVPERRMKLLRYALGRGFTVDEIGQCLKMMDLDSSPDETQ